MYTRSTVFLTAAATEVICYLVPIKAWWGLALIVSILLVLAFVPRGK